jgi:hypothetical protein
MKGWGNAIHSKLNESFEWRSGFVGVFQSTNEGMGMLGYDGYLSLLYPKNSGALGEMKRED